MTVDLPTQLAKPTRLINQSDLRCPAAETCGAGTAVRCRIEHSVIEAATSPSTLQSFCLFKYVECPTWQAEKARIAANKTAPLVSEWDGD